VRLRGRRLGWRCPASTMTQQGAALQNYNNELVKCERRTAGGGGPWAGVWAAGA
jgi:hypothetical protein